MTEEMAVGGENSTAAQMSVNCGMEGAIDARQ